LFETQYCIFFVGTQFWEPGKTLKFLAEQQYFNKDKTSTENPVKVSKSLYEAFGAVSLTSVRTAMVNKKTFRYSPNTSRLHGILYKCDEKIFDELLQLPQCLNLNVMVSLCCRVGQIH